MKSSYNMNFVDICVPNPVLKIRALIWVSFRRVLKFQPFFRSASSNPRRQSKNIKMRYKTHIKLVHEFYGTCIPVHCEELRINHLTPLLVVTMPYTCWLVLVTGRWYWGLQVTSSFSIPGLVLKGCFERGIYWRAKSCLKSIEFLVLNTGLTLLCLGLRRIQEKALEERE